MNKERTDLPLGSCTVPLSLYVHIPFCRSKCDYCDFFSVSGVSESSLKRVLEQEIDRLDFYLSILQPPSIETLYIGGGTPSIVPAPILRSFLEQIFVRLPNIPIESTIEANPESLSREFLEVLRAFPIHRLSLGIQTFQDAFFQMFHRCSSPEINRKALNLVREQWDRKFSIDLLYGIPESSVEDALADLEEGAQYHPHHLSLYQLTSEEHTRYGEWVRVGSLKPISASREEKMRRALFRRARELGFRPYEISNLALPGEECRHNLRYWELRPYLGIGPSAVSTVPGTGSRILRLTETRDILKYLRQGPEADQLFWSTVEVEEIPPEVFMKEVFLMGLRTVSGIRRDSFLRMFGVSIEEVVPRTIEQHTGFFKKHDVYVTLTERGRWWLNRILVDLFSEIDQHPGPVRCVWPL